MVQQISFTHPGDYYGIAVSEGRAGRWPACMYYLKDMSV